MALYHEADRLLVREEVAIIPTEYTRKIAIVQPRVKGWWWFGILGVCPIKDLVVEQEC